MWGVMYWVIMEEGVVGLGVFLLLLQVREVA
jgi:hypothetical protein